MTNILMRAGKAPYEVTSYHETLRRNTIGSNSGNLLFAQAMYKYLGTKGTNVDVNLYRSDPDAADEINEKYDAFVVPLANAFRPGFLAQLAQLTDLVKRLRIPVVVTGAGAQSDLDYSFEPQAPVDQAVKKLIAAVLDKSASVGVRGEFTCAYLNRLGFRNVDIIGCPSMFLRGREMNVVKKLERLGPDAKLLINMSPKVKIMTQIIARHDAKYANVEYIAQGGATFRSMLSGGSSAVVGKHADFHQSIMPGQYHQERIRFFTDMDPWFEHCARFDFSFGTRIHGNVTPILVGTPGVVLAHDSRTLELARYFEIPHHRTDQLDPKVDAASLYEGADYTKMNTGHGERFDRFFAFLEKNGLKHIHQEGAGTNDFQEKMATAQFPPSLTFRPQSEVEVLQDQVKWLVQRQKATIVAQRELRQELEALRASALNRGIRSVIDVAQKVKKRIERP